jgi:hypothetical protein
MSKRGGTSKPSLKQPGTPAPTAPERKKTFSGPPMLGFSRAETEFFLAGQAQPPELPTAAPAVRVGHPRPIRRAALRMLVSAMVAGASVLAWYGPGRVAAPIALSYVQISSPAQTNALSRIGTIFAPQRQVSQLPAPAKIASPPTAAPATTVRPKPHPATANRSRSRHR